MSGDRSRARAAGPKLGAICEDGGVRFRVWAPARRRVEVVLENEGGRQSVRALEKAADGTFGGFLPDIGAGQLYRFRLDEEGPYPDPVSRWQPSGVHGPSCVVDPRRFAWNDADCRGLDRDQLALYELHVGTFSPAGTFAGVRERLPYLRDLGVTAVELMPIADFAGERNWGYDGVAQFAPARCYGSPDELRALVDAAHRLGLGVILDVVYNHFGPTGAYQGRFSERYFSSRHRTPWGASLNFDGEDSPAVREYFIQNALHWLDEYHVDGLRLDATHAILDDGPRHFLAELASRVRGGRRRAPLLIAEDHRNLARMLRPEEDGGWGLDAVWADDFHHQVRRALAGDSEGYFADFSGSMADLRDTVARGWFFRGQTQPASGTPRGTDPGGLAPRRFVICLQNHDQVGNRALGDRLHHAIDLASYRAATVLLLCAPETPLLFMGQEWAASTPFLFFTDHEPGLGKQVTCGRRREFAAFAAFRDDAARRAIPDPQARETFAASVLAWEEIERSPHAEILRLYRALLALRRSEPALRSASWDGFAAAAVDEHGIVLERSAAGAPRLAVAVNLIGGGAIAIEGFGAGRVLLDTEDTAFTADPEPPAVDLSTSAARIVFQRPGAVILAAGEAR